MKDLLTAHPLQVLVVLPEPTDESGMKKLHLLRSWSSWFSGLNIQLHFCLRHPEKDGSMIRALFPFPVFFEEQTLENLAARLECHMEKPVFGHSRTYIPSSLILYDQSEKCFETRRINASALQHLMEAALKIQSRWLKSRIPAQIDTIFCH